MNTGSWTFLHAADLHIDSPLRGLSAYEGAPVEELRLATREAFGRLVEVAIQRGVAFVILAGDVFDGDWPDYDSGLWFTGQMRALEAEGIRVFLLRGNHDAESKVTRHLRWANNVHVFDAQEPESIEVSDLGVVLHGQSFEQAATKDNLALRYPQARDGRLNIGVLHTALGGRAGHDNYAPCSLEDLRSRGYDYWALGHVHKREIVAEDPWVVFPGNTQGRHVGETGAKGATLVHVREGKIHELEAIHCDVARWSHLRIDVAGAAHEDALIASCETELRTAFAAADERLLAVRMTLLGSTELDASLRLDELRLRQEIRALAGRISSSLWVEKVIFKTSPLEEDEQASSGLLGLAQRILEAEVSDEELAIQGKGFEKLASRLPAEILAEWNPTDRHSLQRVLDPARRYLAALLGNEAEGEQER